jgi:GTP cyclohydrolase I
MPIDKVGVKNVTYPIRLRERAGGEQTTVARISMYVSLPHNQKGTHMSRFMEVLNTATTGDGASAVTTDDLAALTHAIRERLDAPEAHFQAEFTYFVRKHAPVTGAVGLMDYKVTIEAVSRVNEAGQVESDFILGVKAPATSLCPCSKEISAYGAHNQRCEIEAKVRFAQPAASTTTNSNTKPKTVWIEDLVEIAEGAASEQVYAVLKRPDEKHVTEAAYDNPKFVEDIVRDLALTLEADDRITWYSIDSENFESIHSHNAYAQITRDKRA